MIGLGLDQLCSVYTETSPSGRYTTLAKSGLKCRLMHVSLRPTTTAPDRAEIAAQRDLMFDPSYLMPEQCQIEVAGVRWQPKAGTYGAFRDWNGTVIYRNCQVVRQQVGAFV